MHIFEDVALYKKHVMLSHFDFERIKAFKYLNTQLQYFFELMKILISLRHKFLKILCCHIEVILVIF